MSKLVFKRATVEWAQRLSNLVNSAYRGDSSKKGWTTEADLLGGQRTDETLIRSMIESPVSQVETLWEGDTLVACVYLKQESEQNSLYLGMLTVDPERQSAGIGRLLLDRAQEIASELKLGSVRMTVIGARPELIAYYERRGFKKTGKIEDFPVGDPKSGIPKTKNREELAMFEMKKPVGMLK